MSEKSVFETLNSVDVSAKVKQKNGLTYLPWSSAWAEVKKRYPDASTKTEEQIDGNGNGRFWHDDGKTGWVKVSVTIQDQTITETLAIMDFKNKSIPADQITSADANKSLKRCLVKALAMHGLGLYIYEGEDLPEEVGRVMELREKIRNILDKKCVTENGKAKSGELCRKAEKEAFPELADEDITGNYLMINSTDILENLMRQLLAIRIK